MSLIIATGTNQGNRLENLSLAVKNLSLKFNLEFRSQIYTSAAIEYKNQPDFLNQVLQFKNPNIDPSILMSILLEIEYEMGRRRDIPKGPRIIDLDVLFIGLSKCDSQKIQVPHPRLFTRSFVVLPLKELPYYQTLKDHYSFPNSFHNTATPFL